MVGGGWWDGGMDVEMTAQCLFSRRVSRVNWLGAARSFVSANQDAAGVTILHACCYYIVGSLLTAKADQLSQNTFSPPENVWQCLANVPQHLPAVAIIS